MDNRTSKPARAHRSAQLFGLLVLFMVLAPSPAHAYIDPLSGSVIFQVVVAGLLAASFTLRTFWTRVVTNVRQAWARISSK